MVLPANYRLKNLWSWGVVGSSGTPANAIGTASEVAIDGLERESDSDRRPGAAGAVHYGGDFNEITATISLTAINEGLRGAVFESVCSNITINMSAVLENIRDACDTATMTIQMRGILLKYPLGWQFSNDVATNEIILGVNYYKEVWKTKVFEYDPDNLIWNWAGTNLWQARQTALGI